MDFDGIAVLDLFAGFGSLGFEALSRGACSISFVDQHVDALKAMKATALQLGVQHAVTIVNADVLAFFGRATTSQFDLIFCDPPYSWSDYEGLIERIFGGNLLAKEGFLLIEHSTQVDLSASPSYSFHKDYGMTRVTFFQQ